MALIGQIGQDSSNQAGNQNNPNNNPPGVNQQNSSGGSQAPTISGAAAAPSGGAPKGSGYTNIQKIIQANQGNTLGQTVGQGIQQAGQQTSQNVNQQQQNFNQQTAQNQFNTAGNQNLVQSVLNNPGQYGQAGNQQGQQFQNLISGQYQGPQGLANAQQLQNQAQNVQQLNQATGTSGGRVGLLQQFVGNPQYTSGQANLDNLLLGQTGGKALAQARQATATVGNQVNNAINGAQAQAAQQGQQANAFGQGVQNALGQQVQNINSGLQNQAQQANTQANTQYQQMLKDAQSGNLTQQEASLLGLTQGEQVTGNVLQGIGSYLQQNPQQATAQNVANAQNYASLDALRQLGGNYTPQQAQAILGQYQGQNANAGTFTGTPIADTTGLQNAITGSVGSYQNALAPTAGRVSGLEGILSALTGPDRAAAEAAVKNNNLQGSYQQNIGWAQGQLGQAQSAYQNALNAANSAYGGLDTININPSSNV